MRPQPLRSALPAKSQSKLWRDASHVAHETAIGREASPGPSNRISRERGQLSLLRPGGYAPKLSALTGKTNLV